MRIETHHVVVDQPAEAVWRAHVKNFQVSLTSGVPQHYSSVEYLDGPPLAPGGIVLVKYNPAFFPHFDYLKLKWLAMDHKGYYAKCEIIEGGHLGGKPDSTSVAVTYALKLEAGPRPTNSCTMVWTFEYDDSIKDNIHEFLKEEMSHIATSLPSLDLSSKAK